MTHNRQKVLDYWNKEETESMYDKHLINSEIRLIKKYLKQNSKVLDAGCGEGEGTKEYSSVKGVVVHAADFSDTRLKKAKRRLAKRKNVSLVKADFIDGYSYDKNYDFVISQRFIINLMDWKIQKKVLLNLMSLLKKGGKLLVLEGCLEGVDALNQFRGACGLKPIPIRWHNLFLSDKKLIRIMEANKYKLVDSDGLGAYFLLTRGIRPLLDKKLNWDSKFNKIVALENVSEILGLGSNFSRLKLWIFQK